MTIDKFTSAFQQALQAAQSLASENNHQFIEPIHILSALMIIKQKRYVLI